MNVKGKSRYAYTEKQKRLAASKMIGAFLYYQKEKMDYDEKKDCYLWQYREGVRVSIKGNRFYEFGSDKKGNAVDFLQEYFRYSQTDAIEELLNKRYPVDFYNEEEECLYMPEPSGDFNKIKSYFAKKGILEDAIDTLIEKNLLYESDIGTPVFIGKKNGEVVSGIEISEDDEYVECQGSDKEYPFIWDGKNYVIIFKSPIEFLSFVTLHPVNWKFNTYIVTGSQSLKGIRQYLDKGNNRRRSIYIAMSTESKENENYIKSIKNYYKYAKIVEPHSESFEEDLQKYNKEQE